MARLSYKTISVNKESSRKEWILVDAENQILGRFSSKVAKILRGKHKTNFTPHTDCGDYVVVINAEKVIMSGDKMEKREIFSHTGFPGGQKRLSPNQMLAKDGTSLIRHAVKGMLPKNKLGKSMIKKLKVFSGSEHSHESQQPIEWNPTI